MTTILSPHTAIVRGSGDIASAVAHGLVRAGYRVVMHDLPSPTTTRRLMAFSDALFDGYALIEGIVAHHAPHITSIDDIVRQTDAVAITSLDLGYLLQVVKPQVLIDARMLKRQIPSPQRGLAPLTIGLGPNFIAGGNVDLAIETSWEQLGRLIAQGPTLPLRGEPRAIGGHARERYVYAPVAGIFRTHHQPGDVVDAGVHLADIGSYRLSAPLSGCLRGLTRNGVVVAADAKVIEVDPRGNPELVQGISERPQRIANAVQYALHHHLT